MLDKLPEETVPIGAALAASDAIHNLRSALDHCVWDVCDAENLTIADQRKIQCPCGASSKAQYEQAIHHIPNLPAHIRQVIASFDIYPGGAGEALRELHALDVIDKHRSLIATVYAVHVEGLKRTSFGISPLTTKTIALRPLRERSYPTMQGNFYEVIPIGECRSNETLEYKLTPVITLREAKALAGVPLVEVLARLEAEVMDVISRIEAAIVVRT